MNKKKDLTDKQKRFIEAYNGNGAEAARVAGYSAKNADKIAFQLLENPDIAEAIRERENARRAALIATREERLIALTEIMRNGEERTSDRLRAAEIMCRAEGDFIDRKEITGPDGQPLLGKALPVDVTLHVVDCVLDDEGSPIHREGSPKEYAAKWLKQFFYSEIGKPEMLTEFAAEIINGEIELC